jgi:hypothetical protein
MVLLVLAVMMGDWWGVTNVLAMMASVVVRQIMVVMLRAHIDDSVRDIAGAPEDEVKTFLTIPNGKAVTLLGPRAVIVNCVLTDPKPARPWVYNVLRTIGWTAFGVHAISLGMSSLVSQILSVVLLLASTVLKAYRVGDRPYAVGRRLTLDFDMGDPSWFRKPAYIRLKMNKSEEDNMVHWNLLPQRTNDFWWQRYRAHENVTRAAEQQEGIDTTARTDSANASSAKSLELGTS